MPSSAHVPDSSEGTATHVDAPRSAPDSPPVSSSPVKLKVALRADGWWVENQQGDNAAGPFRALSEVQNYLDWLDNQQPKQGA